MTDGKNTLDKFSARYMPRQKIHLILFADCVGELKRGVWGHIKWRDPYGHAI